jgi:hypothetical protein
MPRTAARVAYKFPKCVFNELDRLGKLQILAFLYAR